MAITHARVAINDSTATMVTPASEVDARVTSCTVQIQNLGSAPIYIGNKDITSTSYGCSVVAGAAITFDELPPKDELYVLSSSGSGYVGILVVLR